MFWKGIAGSQPSVVRLPLAPPKPITDAVIANMMITIPFFILHFGPEPH
jgi:hypothetical protein